MLLDKHVKEKVSLNGSKTSLRHTTICVDEQKNWEWLVTKYIFHKITFFLLFKSNFLSRSKYL